MSNSYTTLDGPQPTAVQDPYDPNLKDPNAGDYSAERTNLHDMLRGAKRKFQRAVDHAAEQKQEAHQALRFYHNSELVGQWSHDDLAYLREQGRPAFSFNIIAAKVNDFLGFYQDAERSPEVVADGMEDQLLAKVLNIATEETMAESHSDMILTKTLRTGTVTGECAVHIEISESPKGPGWVKITLYRIMPFELHWDAASLEADRSDARCVFWDRWLDEDEFNDAYPGHDGAFGRTRGMAQMDAEGTSRDDWTDWFSEEDGDKGSFRDDYQDQVSGSRYYYDRYEDKVRVVRYEYKTFVTKYSVTDLESGQVREDVPEPLARRAMMAQQMGEPLAVQEHREEVVKGFDFVGSDILEIYETVGPFDGFSIVNYAYAIDEETGTPYGIVRNLLDPQQELNKAQSLKIEHIAQMVNVGTIGEKDAVTDEVQFTDEMRRPGGHAVVEKDALVEGRVREKQVSPPNAAVIERAATAVDLLNEISGIPSSVAVTAAEAQQGGVGVTIRYNKARQSVSGPFGNFEEMQSQLYAKIVQTIVRAMPDDQVQALVSSDRYRVQNGMIIELTSQQTPQGPQSQPTQIVPLRDMRTLNYNIDLENKSENSTLRMLVLSTLQQLSQAGTPVDPDVMVELATSSRSRRERLKAYVEQVQAQQAQAAQMQAQAQQQQVEQLAQLEMAKVQTQAQKNQADAMLKAQAQAEDAWKDRADVATDVGKLWLDAEDNEKQRMDLLARRLAVRDGAQAAY